MKLSAVVAIVFLIATSAFAQQKPSDEELNAAMQTLQAQRNEEANKVVNMTMVATRLQKRIADLEAEVAKLTPKPKEEPKK